MLDPAGLLQNAIDRNAPAALAVTAGGTTRLYRSRFLAGDEGGLWLAMPAGSAETVDVIDALTAAGHAVRVTFKCRENNVEFTARLVERRRAFALNPHTFVEAVRLDKPTTATVVQRRSAYRVNVSGADDVTLKFWRIAPDAKLTDTPPDDAAMDVDVRDFSNAGSGGVWKRRRGEEAVLPSAQRLRVDVVTPGTTVTLEAYVRFVAALPEPEFRRVGVQFMFVPTSLADRGKLIALNRITGELQRAELKRLRTAR